MRADATRVRPLIYLNSVTCGYVELLSGSGIAHEKFFVLQLCAKQYERVQIAHTASEMQTDVEFYRYYRVKGVVLQSQGHYAEATACYKKLTDMLRNGYRDTQDFKLYADLSDCYIALHRPADALQALQTAYALRDSMFRHENTSQLSYFSVKYDMKEKELKIRRLRSRCLSDTASATS